MHLGRQRQWFGTVEPRSVLVVVGFAALAGVAVGMLGLMRLVLPFNADEATAAGICEESVPSSTAGLEGPTVPPAGSSDHESALYEFETWRPVLCVIHRERPDLESWSGGIGLGAFSVPEPSGDHSEYYPPLMEASKPLQAALRQKGMSSISFSVQIDPDGRVVVTPAAESPTHAIVRDMGMNYAGHVVLVDGAQPAAARAKPQEFPGTGPSSSADPDELARVLRGRMPDAVGATDEELAALEDRLGMPLPPELRAVLGVRAHDDHYGKHGEDDRYQRDIDALGDIGMFPLELIERASEADVRKGIPFDVLALDAAVTTSESKVQGLHDPWSWIVIGDYGGGTGDWVAIDVRPGPAGHYGQLVVLDHESNMDAGLLADSFTELVTDGGNEWPGEYPHSQPPANVMINSAEGWTAERAAAPELQVLTVGSWDDQPTDLSPLTGAPNLRSLFAEPGGIVDPLVIGELGQLEYLEIGVDEWQALLDADAVPGSLLAAGVAGHDVDPAQVDHIYDQLISRWGGEPGRTRTIEGNLTAGK